MRSAKIALFALLLSISPFAAMAQNPFVGGWGLSPAGGGAGWLGVTEENGQVKASLMWIGGSVVPFKEARVENGQFVGLQHQEWDQEGQGGRKTHMTMDQTFTARRSGDTLEGSLHTTTTGGRDRSSNQNFTGKRLPPMPPAPDLSKVRFGRAMKIFNGRDLTGWRLTDPNAVNGWKVENGELINNPVQTEGQPHKNYGNLRTDQEFEDFRITLEVNVPKGGNSGVYLRGIYEVQVEDSYGEPADPHHMGAVYSRIKPTATAEKPAGEWQTMDITLVDRHVTVILNGTKIIDNQPVLGPTGGALWADVARPGPIYLQGDHAAVKYRNIVLRPVQK